MNFILNQDGFCIDYVYFLESKINMMMEGNFTKIFYSTPFVILNNIFIDIKIVPKNIHKMNNYNEYSRENGKYIIYFDLNENMKFFHTFIEIEKKILEYYKQYRCIDKIPEYTLKNQIMNGYLKFYNNMAEGSQNSNNYYLKISGVWENYTNFGITYKIIEYHS
jgi:hypothetical protein